MINSTKSKAEVFLIFILVLLVIGAILCVFYFNYQRYWAYDPVVLNETESQYHLNWAVKEDFSISYEDCKNLNRSVPINRILRPDYKLPMCPKAKVLLYDASQKYVFKFNEELNEKANVMVISTTCDNSTGACS